MSTLRCELMNNRRIYRLVKGLRAAEGPLDSGDAASREHVGAKGWHTRGYLPHADFPGTLQMITFRLADAMPAERRSEWEKLFQIEDQREQRTKLEDYLDRGCGACWLKQPEVAAAVERTLLHSDGRRYRLAAWVVMPNHVHVLVELWTISLSGLTKAWKGSSANAVNQLLGRSGQLWQEDYWDRFIRDEEHFRKARNYIERNPVKAGLVPIAADWPYSSANEKWRWTGPNRYHLAQLVNPATLQLPSETSGVERGHSCPQNRREPESPGVNVEVATLYTSAGVPVERAIPTKKANQLHRS
jgi:putative transposase